MTQQEYIKIYEEHQGLVAALAIKKLYDKSYLEDAQQEVWLKVWRSRASFDPAKSSITTWLHHVATSVLDSFLERHFEKQPQHVLDSSLVSHSTGVGRSNIEDGDTPSYSWIEETVETPYDTQEDFETLDALIFAGSTLSEQESAVFNLVYWHGWSYDAVAKKFGIEVNTIGSVVSRLRSKIERGMRPVNDIPRYYPPGNVWGDWSWKPDGLGNVRMENNNNNYESTNSQRSNQ